MRYIAAMDDRLARTRRPGGIRWMLLGVALFAVNDALGKWLVTDYPVGQILAIRSAAALCLLLPLAWHRRRGGRERGGRHAGLHLARVLLVVLEVACFYVAVRDLPLAEVMAIYLAAPLFVAALSMTVLGEPVDRRRVAWILVGFCGVLIVLRPSAETVSWPALIALLGSLTFAAMMLITRRLRDTAGLTLVTAQVAGVALAGLATLPFGWIAPGPLDLGLIATLGIVSMLGHASVNRSLKLSPAAVVAPFQYTSILWAIALGIAVWGDWPGPLALLGAALIVASGLLILRAERTPAGRNPSPAGEVPAAPP